MKINNIMGGIQLNRIKPSQKDFKVTQNFFKKDNKPLCNLSLA